MGAVGSACPRPPFVPRLTFLFVFSGIVGFGAQILGMRVGLGLGLNYNRIVVGNPGHEASMVQSELKWR